MVKSRFHDRSPNRSDPNMPQRSYSYGRISTGGRQARGDGLRRQQGKLDEHDESWPEKVSREQGWVLNDTLRFTDRGRSGYHQENLGPKAALTRFLEFIDSGRIAPGSVLLIDKLDRLTRAEVDDAYDLFRGILRRGVWICTRDPFRIYKVDPDQPSGLMDIMEPLWTFYLNWLESEKKSDNATHAWEAARHRARQPKAARTPLPTSPPCWVVRTETGYAEDPVRKALVKRLIHMARSGMGTARIAAQMIAEKVPGLGRSGRWSGPGVYQLLTSRTLVGEYQPHTRRKVTTPDGGVRRVRVPEGDAIPGFYPHVLDENEFLALQAALGRRAGRRGRPGKSRVNIFVGILYEATRRERLSMQTAGTHGKEVPYLSRGQVAGTVRIRYDDLERVVLDTLAMLRPADVMDRPEKADANEHRIHTLSDELTELTERHKKLSQDTADVTKDFDSTSAALQAVVRRRKAVAEELNKLKLESTTGRAEALGEAQATVREIRQAATDEERQGLDMRLQAVLPTVMPEIWVQVQKLSARRQVVHVQMVLRTGASRYATIYPPNYRGEKLWDLEGVGWDLRRGPYLPPGEVADQAAVPPPA